MTIRTPPQTEEQMIAALQASISDAYESPTVNVDPRLRFREAALLLIDNHRGTIEELATDISRLRHLFNGESI